MGTGSPTTSESGDDMEVQQARAFLVVAEELHFGRAADRLRMAQPPLSRMIKKLEQSLRTELFERSTRHVELTPAGEALIEPARRLVAASEAARRTVVETVKGEIGVVNFGFAGASVHDSVGEIARQVRRHCPRVKLELHSSQFSHTALQRVLDGSLDAAIGRWDFLPAEVASMVMGVEEAIIALPAIHPLAGRDSVSMKELADEQWVVLPGGFGSALQNRLNSLAMAAGFVPHVAHTAPDSWTLVVLVGAEMGCALTLDTVRDNVSSENVVFLPVREGHNKLDVRLIWNRTNRNPALRSVLETARRVFPAPESEE